MGKKILWALAVAALIVGGASGVFYLNTLALQKRFQEAKDALRKGNVQQATDLFEQVYRKRPSSSEGFESLGNLCQLTISSEQNPKNIEYAHAFLDRAGNDADKARGKYYLGSALYFDGNILDALKEFSEVTSKYATSSVADDALFMMAKANLEKGHLLESRELLRTIIERYPDSNLIAEVYGEYGKVNVALLFSATPTPNSFQYTVVANDKLESIARKFGTTSDLIRAANGLTNNKIRKGNLLKIDKGKYSTLVSKSRNTLTLSCNGELFKIYSVGTGRSNSTPVGDYKITNKMVNPPWYRPGGGMVPFGDKGNLLGTRWMGINLTGYGIHGTWEPDTIGKQSSSGCVRLLNEEVEELFKIVDVGTTVKVVD